jgi:hypothetical protein
VKSRYQNLPFKFNLQRYIEKRAAAAFATAELVRSEAAEAKLAAAAAAAAASGGGGGGDATSSRGSGGEGGGLLAVEAAERVAAAEARALAAEVGRLCLVAASRVFLMYPCVSVCVY